MATLRSVVAGISEKDRARARLGGVAAHQARPGPGPARADAADAGVATPGSVVAERPRPVDPLARELSEGTPLGRRALRAAERDGAAVARPEDAHAARRGTQSGDAAAVPGPRTWRGAVAAMLTGLAAAKNEDLGEVRLTAYVEALGGL